MEQMETISSLVSYPIVRKLRNVVRVGLLLKVLIWSCATGQAQDASSSVQIRLDASTEVIYQNVAPSDSSDAGPFGKITIRSIPDGHVVYVQNAIIGPCSCLQYPAVSLLHINQSAEVRLGTDSNASNDLLLMIGEVPEHTILRVVRSWIDGPSVAAIDIGSSPPVLSWNPDSKTYIVQGDRVHQSYLMVYALYIDQSTTAFMPLFGKSASRFYRARFNELMRDYRSEISSHAGQLIAAIVATEDENSICQSIVALRSQGLREAEITRWLQVIPTAGFPAFDLHVCKGF